MNSHSLLRATANLTEIIPVQQRGAQVSHDAVQLLQHGCMAHMLLWGFHATRCSFAHAMLQQSSMQRVRKGDIPFARSLESSISCGPGAASRDLWRDLERSHRAPCSGYRM